VLADFRASPFPTSALNESPQLKLQRMLFPRSINEEHLFGVKHGEAEVQRLLSLPAAVK
jgi:hypothetical protein